MPAYEHDGIRVSFSDKLPGMSVSALIQNTCTFHVKVFRDGQGELFSLISPDYKIAMSIQDGAVVLRRNEYEARKEIGRVQRHYQILASWKPDRFQLALMIDDDVGGEGACVTVDTPPIYVPVGLLDWARRFSLLPRKTYSSAADFLSVFLESLRQAAQTIRDANCYSLFWDRQKPQGAPQRLVPKREPEAVAGIAAFLQDQSLIGGYQIFRESQAGAGSSDIRVVAPLSAGGLVNICVEGKNAHSTDLEHGISDQLPAYMRSVRPDYGVYLVLWYQCEAFPQPEKNAVDITWQLTKLRPFDNIVVEKFDLAFQERPSDRDFEYV